MALTRPKISQINTKVTALTDPITVLNAGATTANVDSGFLINRAHGLISNAAIYYSETLDTFVTAFTGNSGGIDSNITVTSYADFTTGNVFSTGITVTGNVDYSLSPNVNLGSVGNLIITGGQYGQILQTLGNGELTWIDNIPGTVTYTANSISLTGGVYVSGGLSDIQTFGDYGSGNVYVLTDGSGSAPAWYVDIGFVGVANFNRVVLNINYTQSSGHTIYVQLYNNNTSAWDNIGTYTGLGSYYAFALQVINDANYINSGAVQLRLYHSNAGAVSHQTSIDYAALELSNQGPQGPRGLTGATGATGAGVATGGTAGQVLVKNSGTNYDTAWASNLTLSNLNLVGTGDISSNIGSLYLSGSLLSANVGAYQFWANANAASQYTYLTSLDANITAVNVAIAGLQSNAAFQANLIDILTGNAATQGSLLDVLVANAVEQSANLTSLLSNAAAQEASLTSLVNNAASQSGALDSINANVGAYQTYANANAAVQAISIDSINANVGAYQTYANANAAVQAGYISTLQTQVYSNVNAAAYLAGNITVGNIQTDGYYFANGAPFTTSNYGNVDVEAYLPTSTVIIGINANVAAANASIITANTDMKNYVDDQFVLAGGYGNTQVAAYLPVHGGNISAANITATGNIVGGGVRNTVGSSPPANPVPGDTWYDTDNDTLLRYVNDGDSNQWVDISSVVVASLGGGYRYTASATPPGTATPGDNWYDTTTGILFRYVNDGAQSYWVDNSSIGLELQSYGNTQVAAYLPVHGGNISAVGYYWANGQPFVSSVYGNANVTAYIPTDSTIISLQSNIVAANAAIVTANTGLKNYVDGQITSLINSAPGVLDTLGEIATAMGNDANLSVTLTTLISNVQANVTAANSSIITANTGMKSYVDARTYSNVNTAAYLAGNVTTGNVFTNGLFYANGTPFSTGGGTSTSAYMLSYIFGA